MKKFKRILMQSILWLSIAMSQHSVLAAENLNDKLTKPQIDLAVNGVINALVNNYIYPEKALLIEKELRHKVDINEFTKINDWYAFIREINLIIRNVSGDMYLDVVETKPVITLESTADKTELPKLANYNLDNVSILFGNVGYFKLDYFSQNPEAEIGISRALDALSNTDALIIDLRSAEGDSLTLAQYLMSFFVNKDTLLSKITYAPQKKELTLTSLNIGGIRFKSNFPVYLLTSSFLSGSGEFVAYTLKYFKKAVIVGEETMGVAYVIKKQKINAHISLNIPVAIPLHPKTNNNWERTGVTPDVYSAADLGLETAHKLAKEYLGIF
ncbi:S41 family peptidase [Colwelliaceae bacterium 6471]